MPDNELYNSSEVRNANSNGDVLVSVIVCTYNQEKYIAQTLEAILCQKTDFRFEILVGDDASTDGTSRIVKKYAAKFPNVVRAFCRNDNVGACRNGYDMLQHMKGTFLANCDGDDFWSDEYKLQKDIDFLRAHDEYVAVVSDAQPVDKRGVPIPLDDVPVNRRFWLFERSEYTKVDFEQWKMPGHGCTLVSRNIYKEHNIDPTIFFEASRNVGDRTSMLLLTHFGKIFCDHSRIGVNYRMIFDQNSANHMTVYQNNNMRAEEVRGIRAMEAWVDKHLGKKSDLSFAKKDRLSSSVAVFLKSPTLKNLAVVHKLCRYSGATAKYYYYAMKAMVLKLYYLNVLKEDKRVIL